MDSFRCFLEQLIVSAFVLVVLCYFILNHLMNWNFSRKNQHFCDIIRFKNNTINTQSNKKMASTPKPVKISNNWLKMISSSNEKKVKNKTDLEKIVSEFERSFESPKGTKRRKSFFVKKIVAAIEEKYNPSRNVSSNSSKLKPEPNICDMRPFQNETLFQNIRNRQSDVVEIGGSQTDEPSTSIVNKKFNNVPRKFMSRLMRLFSKSRRKFSISSTYDHMDVDLNYPNGKATDMSECGDASILDRTISVSSGDSDSEDDISNFNAFSNEILRCSTKIPRPELVTSSTKIPKHPMMSKVPKHPFVAQTPVEMNSDMEIVMIRTQSGRRIMNDHRRSSTLSTFSDAPPIPPITKQKVKPYGSLPKFTNDDRYEMCSNVMVESMTDMPSSVVLRKRNRPSLSRQSRLSEPTFATMGRGFGVPRASWSELGNYQSVEELSTKFASSFA